MANMPEGFHTITPNIVVSDAEKAIALYEAALGATLSMKMMMPGTAKVMHACVQIGNSKLFLCDELPMFGTVAPKGKDQGSSFYVYVDDVDAQHSKALKAGMEEKSAPTDMFWGDRNGVVLDPYGHSWTLATKVREVSVEDMQEAVQNMAG